MTTASPLAWPDGWPRTPAARRRSRFALKATFAGAREALYRELRLLGATSCVISCNLELRLNGEHKTDRADQLLNDPGVAIYFTLRERQLVIASDRYESPAANLRSVGLGVEYLRGLERHGGGHMMERAFSGFTALPPPAGAAAAPVARPWREVLAPIPAGLGNTDTLLIAESRYREAARTAHTDAGGDGERMIILNAAIADARAELKP